jgi:hypothetical protein
LAQKCVRFGIPFVPAYVNQNCVETWFSLQRARGGLNNSPTVAQYRNNQSSPLTHLHLTKTNQKSYLSINEKEKFVVQPLQRRSQTRKINNEELTEEIYTLSEQEGMFVMMIRYHFTF